MLMLSWCKDGFNLSLLYSHSYIIIILCFYNIITYNDLDKHLFINVLLHCKNKYKGLHITLIGVYVGNCMQAVTEASFALGQLFSEAILSQQPSQQPK